MNTVYTGKLSSEIIFALENNLQVITPNQRLATSINRAWAEHNQMQVWLKPNVQSLEGWLSGCWLSLQNLETKNEINDLLNLQQRRIINGFEFEELWLDFFKHQPDIHHLTHQTLLAKDAVEAFERLILWNKSEQDIEQILYSQTVSHFLDWQTQIFTLLEEQNLITQAQSNQAIFSYSNYLTENIPSLFKDQFYLADFDQIAPLHQVICESFCNQVIFCSSFENQHSIQKKIQYDLPKEEYLAAARWANNILVNHFDKSDLFAIAPKIGIISASIGEDRNNIERAFMEVFEPQYLLPKTDRYKLPFTLSTGTPLAQVPLIETALNLLSLNTEKLSSNKYYALLQSHYWGFNDNYLVRSIWQKNIQDKAQRELSTAEFRQALPEKLPEIKNNIDSDEVLDEENLNKITSIKLTEFNKYVEKIRHALQAYQDRIRHKPKKLSLVNWVEIFNQQLEDLSWPSNIELDSIEHQQIFQWQQLLEILASTQLRQSKVDIHQALNLLKKLAQRQPFQPELPDGPIAILGPLEAAGQAFSHLWICGVNQQQWPPAASPNRFIPIPLQIEWEMPQSSAQRELNFYKKLLRQYQSQTSELIFSFAKIIDGVETSCSPLIKNVDQFTDQNSKNVGVEISSELKHYYHESLAQPLQKISWHQAISPIKHGQLLSHSANILKNQAIWPLAAFFIHRAGAEDTPTIHLGITRQMQGNLLHRVLELFWNKVESSRNLLKINDATEKVLLLECIDQALNENILLLPKSPLLKTLETNRLLEHLKNWLACERQREKFEVADTEKSIFIQLSEIGFKLRADRIDKMEDGSLVIIDYKSQAPAISHWLGSPLKEPQLPLYALALKKQVSAIAYGIINPNKIQFSGIGESTRTDVNPIENNSWQEQINLWKQNCELLAEEIQQGHIGLTAPIQSLPTHWQFLIPLDRRNEIL